MSGPRVPYYNEEAAAYIPQSHSAFNNRPNNCPRSSLRGPGLGRGYPVAYPQSYNNGLYNQEFGCQQQVAYGGAFSLQPKHLRLNDGSSGVFGNQHMVPSWTDGFNVHGAACNSWGGEQGGRGTTRGRKTSQRPMNVGLRPTFHDQLLQLLRSCPDQSEELKIIVSRMGGIEKSNVNSCLYEMQKMGLVEKIKNQPPKWKAICPDQTTGPSRPSKPQANITSGIPPLMANASNFCVRNDEDPQGPLGCGYPQQNLTQSSWTTCNENSSVPFVRCGSAPSYGRGRGAQLRPMAQQTNHNGEYLNFMQSTSTLSPEECKSVAVGCAQPMCSVSETTSVTEASPTFATQRVKSEYVDTDYQVETSGCDDGRDEGGQRSHGTLVLEVDNYKNSETAAAQTFDAAQISAGSSPQNTNTSPFKIPFPPKDSLKSTLATSTSYSNTPTFKIPPSPKELIQMDPKFSQASSFTSCTCECLSSDEMSDSYHSLPSDLKSLSFTNTNNLQRSNSLYNPDNQRSNPFAKALHLQDDGDDDANDDVMVGLQSFNSFPRSSSWNNLSTGGSFSGSLGGDGRMEGWGGGGSGVVELTGETFAALNKNSISAIMEYAQARKMEAEIVCIDSRGPSHKPKFLMAMRMGSRWFPRIECSNKKDGRKEAADVALRLLMAEGSYQMINSAPLSFESLGAQATRFDSIASLAHQKFNQLAVTVMESMVGKKVLAAFIMTTGPDDCGTVISMGTGNRCITGTYLSLEGQTVNDSHAEVICRRGLIRFLYKQLLAYSEGRETILEPSSSSSTSSLVVGGKLKVKDDISFHLYISTAPCGDGALFSPRDIVPVGDAELSCHSPLFANKLQGKLRTKVEGGEGTIPIEDGAGTQCWDGIVRGERLRTMSCSDKVCRWNLVGLQGALLTYFIEPIYMTSLTLGFLYDHGHLSRAVCCRLSHGDPDISADLPAGYRINHPRLGRVTAYDATRETQKTKELSVNWSYGDQTVELTDGTRGICVSTKNGQSSQLAKCSLFQLFHQCALRLNRHDLLSCTSYHDAKQRATDFRAANQLMCRKFKKNGYGTWVTKPVEEELFTWST